MTRWSNKAIAIGLGLFALFMVGFSFALIPLYNVLCDALGINGKTSTEASASYQQAIDKTRLITVEFVANKNSSLRWSFHPNQNKITVHPGENKKITYFAKNNTDKAMTVQAVPSVAPGLAAQYLKKTECFCFVRQKLAAGASRDMPLIFHLDPKLPKNINTLTLSYTLFAVDTEQKE